MLQFKNISNISFVRHGITEVGEQPPADVIRGEQVHKNAASWVTADTPNIIPKVDALATREPGRTLGVFCADCVPLLFVDTRQHCVGALHAGWRGTALEIARKAFESLNIPPFSLQIGLGPAICPKHFTVGEEVARQFDARVVQESTQEEGVFHVDLWQANVLHLLELGVPERNIEVMRLCTVEHRNLPSFRRDHTSERSVAFIELV